MTEDLDPSLRRLFAAGPGAEPPLGLTPASVLASGRAARRRRRGTLAGAATGLAVVAVVGAVTVSLTAGTPGSPAADPPPACAPPPSRATVLPSPSVEVSPRGTVAPTPLPTRATASPSSAVEVSAQGTVAPTPLPAGPTASPGPAGEVSPRGTAARTPLATRPFAPAVTPPIPRPTAGGMPEPCPPEVTPTGASAAPTGASAAPSTAPQDEARLLARLTAALRRALPLPAGGRAVRSTAGEGHDPLVFYAAHEGYHAAADVVDPLGTSSIQLELHTEPFPPDLACEPPSCSRTARGDVVIVDSRRLGTGTYLSVQAIRPDGTSVFVAVTDYPGNEPGPDDSAPRSARPTLPWTRPDLVTLALTPTLHL